MILTQNFAADFDTLAAGLSPNYSGRPYALVRFGDGEAAIMRGERHEAISDHWIWKGSRRSPLAKQLRACLRADLPYFLQGITAHSHHPYCHDWLLSQVTCPRERVTFAEIWIFANYRRWKAIETSHCVLVSPHGQVKVPFDGVNTNWDCRPTVDELIATARTPIIVAAGPLANVLIHDYWQRCPDDRKQVILDVGSAVDEGLKGKKTRRYQYTHLRQYRWKPTFYAPPPPLPNESST